MDTSVSTTTTVTPIPPIPSPAIKEFLASYEQEEHTLRQQENTNNIQVSRAASTLAVIYERIRQVLDYQEESVLRRRAIERILFRRLTTGKNGERSLAEGLIKELIWAHYIDNNVLPQERIDEVTTIVQRYKVLLERNTYKQTKKLPDLRDWIIGVMASEIEQMLVPHFTADALVHLMYRSLDHSESAFAVDEATKNLQIFLSIQRALLKADNSLLRYRLLTSYYPNWTKNESALTQQIADHFIQIVEAIEFHLKHHLGERLLPVIRKQTAPFIILKAITDKNKKNREEVLAVVEQREAAVRELCKERYQTARKRIQRAAFRSIMYLFITKMTLAFLVELPADRILYGTVHYIPLAINVLFPPTLMFMVAMTIRVPGEKNTEKIIRRLSALIEDPDGRHSVKLKIPGIRARSNVYIYVYVATFFISFGLIAWLLSRIHFNFVSGILFFFFTCLVSFFAFRIRQTARELVVVDNKESFFAAVIDFFFLPFLRVGRWLSQAFSRINIFIFIFDFILEAPLKSLITVAEEWFSFIREKKDEIV